jgi:hypothetical protein
MTADEMEQARHAEERGAILLALHQEYERPMTSVRSLSRGLDLLGIPLSRSGLRFHLALLHDLGYLRIWRACEVAGWRPDRENEVRADDIVFAKLLPRGLQLIDGRIPADVQVTF